MNELQYKPCGAETCCYCNDKKLHKELIAALGEALMWERIIWFGEERAQAFNQIQHTYNKAKGEKT